MQCKYDKDLKSCQILANLCVLQLYREDSLACYLFKSITEERAANAISEDYPNSIWKADMPWLYYEKGALAEVRKESIDIQVAFHLE